MMMKLKIQVLVTVLAMLLHVTNAFVPLIDGGKTMPKLYDGWLNEQIAKQASNAVSKAISDGYTKIEVNFPPVPNLDEVRTGIFNCCSRREVLWFHFLQQENCFSNLIYPIFFLPPTTKLITALNTTIHLKFNLKNNNHSSLFILLLILLFQVKFGTPLNQKFGKTVVAKDLSVQGGYTPGSDLSRQLVAFSNIYWAKKIASSVKGGPLGNKCVACLTTEPVSFSQIKNKGDITRVGAVMSPKAREEGRNNEAIICVNPGGEERWDTLVSAHCQPNQPFIVLNNAYSTSYNLGNKRGYEEAYFLKRISKGWVFRLYPGPWEAYLEKPDGTVELLESYDYKPELRDVAKFVREESFRRYAINNDRWSPGFGERL